MRNMALREVADRLGVVVEGRGVVGGYQIDSRLVGRGDLFFALKGERVDGHDFLLDVSRKGAIGAVVEEGYQGSDFGLELIRVEGVLGALQSLAKGLMKEFRGRVVGVTGSLGKTTTKEFLATILEGKWRVGKTFLSQNTKVTYPLTLLNRRGDEEVMVVELGMTEPGDIGRLVDIAAPDVAVLTKIAWVHGAFFPRGLEDIAKYKAEIFGKEKTKVCVLDEELKSYAEVMKKAAGKKVTFFKKEDVSGWNVPFKEAHILHNVAAAVATAREMGMSVDEVKARLPLLKLPKMRFEVFEKGGITFVNDAYNANPDSMRAAIGSLPKAKGKTIAVLGMMIDMGKESEKIHREVGAFAKGKVDYLLVMGKEAKGIADGYGKAEEFADFNKLAERLKQLMKSGDVVLVKGSRVVGMERLFDVAGIS